MLWSLPLVPLVAGAAIWASGDRRSRLLLGGAGSGGLIATLGLAVWSAAARPDAVFGWGAGLALTAAVDDVAAVVAVLVPVVALPVVVYAAAHEPPDGLARLVGLLVAFAGAMELLVAAADLLTLLIGWELVGFASWGLIAHQWREPERPAGAAHAFNVTRFGDLGLFLAAMAAFTGAGTLRYDGLPAVGGVERHLLVGGIVLAAAAKSGQVPFSPWLYSAMAGPTPVSALLHSATMVAAGAFLLARLEPVLAGVWWFGPVVVGLGLATALVGGVAASAQHHVKKLLAASTCAQYGLMFVAVGAGSAAAAVAHLVGHALAKSLLFLAAGVAIAAVGNEQLARMRLGTQLPVVAVLALVGALALAAVPPLGAAWTKEQVVAAAGERGTWLAVLVILTGGLSAFYAARFQLLAFAPGSADREVHRPGRAETVTLGLLAALTLGLGVAWLPGVAPLAPGPPWELAASLVLVAAGIYAALGIDREQRLGTLGMPTARQHLLEDWLGLPTLAKAAVVDPTLALCRRLASFDDRVVDAGVRGAARIGELAAQRLARGDDRVVDAGVRGAAAFGAALSRAFSGVGEWSIDGAVERLGAAVGFVSQDARRLQTGLAHHYYVIAAVGLVVLTAAAALWRS